MKFQHNRKTRRIPLLRRAANAEQKARWSECSAVHESQREALESEEINNSNVFVVQSVRHSSATLGGRCARLCSLTAPENKLITTSRQLPTEDPDGLSPSSVIALPAKPSVSVFFNSNGSSPLFNSLFPCCVPPFFNRCYYEEDASALNTNPSFDAVLKDYSDAWVFPGIKIARCSVSMSNKAFPRMTCHKETEEPCTGCVLFAQVTVDTSKNRPRRVS